MLAVRRVAAAALLVLAAVLAEPGAAYMPDAPRGISPASAAGKTGLAAAGVQEASQPVASKLEALVALGRRRQADRCVPEHRALMTKCQEVLDQTWQKYEDTTLLAGTRAFSQLHELVDQAAASAPGMQGLAVLVKGANKELIDSHMRAGVASRLTCYRALGNAEVEGTYTLHTDCFHVAGRTGTTCLFFHGPGYEGPSDRHLSRAGPDARYLHRFELDYGEVENVLGNQKQCDPVFFSTETLQRGWEDASLQAELCDAVAAVQPDQVFSTSVTSLALAAGAARGLRGCTQLGRGAFDAHWYSVGSPFRGAPVDFVDGVCKSCVSHLAKTKGFPWMYDNKLTSAGVCAVVKPFYLASFCERGQSGDQTLLPAYRSLQPGFVNQRAHYAGGSGLELSDEAARQPAKPADDPRPAPAARARRRVCNCPTATQYRKALDAGEPCEKVLRPFVPPACLDTCRAKSAWRTARGPKSGRRCEAAETSLAEVAAAAAAAAAEPATPQLACGEAERAVPGPKCVTLHEVAARLTMGQMCGADTGASESPERWWTDTKTWVAEKAFGLASHVIGSDWGEGDEVQNPPAHFNDGLVPAHSCKLTAQGGGGATFVAEPYAPYYAIQTHAWGARCTNRMRTTADPRRDPCQWYTFAAGNTKARLAYELGVECGEGGAGTAGVTCPAEVARLLALLRATLDPKARQHFEKEAKAEAGAVEKRLAGDEARREVENVVDDFIAALDDNRDRHVSTAEFRWWEVMQGGRLVAGGSSEPVVYATFDEDVDGRLTTDELRAGLLRREPSKEAVHALTDKVRAWHWDVTRLTLRAGAAPAPTRLTRLVKERRWQELVEDLYAGAFVRGRKEAGTDPERLKQRFGLTDWDLDFLETAERDGVLKRMAADGLVRLYQDTRSKNRAPAEVVAEFFLGVDTNQDGALSRAEVEQFSRGHCGGFCAPPHKPLPDASVLLSDKGWDTNGDGAVSLAEFSEHLLGDLGRVSADDLWEISAGVRDAGRATHAAAAYARGATEQAVEATEALRWIRERKWDFLRAEYRRVFHGGEAKDGAAAKDAANAAGKVGAGEHSTPAAKEGALPGPEGLPESLVTFVEAGEDALDPASLSLITSFVLPLHYIRDVTKPASAGHDRETSQLLSETRREAAEEAKTAKTEEALRAAEGHKTHATVTESAPNSRAAKTAVEARAEDEERREVEALQQGGGQAAAANQNGETQAETQAQAQTQTQAQAQTETQTQAAGDKAGHNQENAEGQVNQNNPATGEEKGEAHGNGEGQAAANRNGEQPQKDGEQTATNPAAHNNGE